MYEHDHENGVVEEISADFRRDFGAFHTWNRRTSTNYPHYKQQNETFRNQTCKLPDCEILSISSIFLILHCFALSSVRIYWLLVLALDHLASSKPYLILLCPGRYFECTLLHRTHHTSNSFWILIRSAVSLAQPPAWLNALSCSIATWGSVTV
jgi:hypothetical protein